MNLTIFHYHLRKGGVTDTIYHSISSFLEDSYSLSCISHIDIVCGEQLPLTHKLHSLIQKHAFISLHIEPAIQYITDIGDEIHIEQSLASCFQKFHDPHGVWWVHNHHLGKNPIFTRMLMQFLEDTAQPSILEIHDFPEAARFDNMTALEKVIPLSQSYNNSPHTVFTTINTYNTRTLQQAGLQSQLLANVIPSQSHVTYQSVKQDIIKYFPQYAGMDDTHHEDYLLFTYPVRCIRRKNVLEGALITKLYELYTHQKSLFCITLAGVSETEKKYSQLVHEQFRQGHIKGFFDIGNSLDTHNINFEHVTQDSNIIISPSVQEGFGFSYCNSVHWGTPLLARNIFVAEDVDSALSPHWQHYWYDELIVPFDVLESIIPHAKVSIESYYNNKILQIHTHYSPELIAGLQQELNLMLEKSYIDFSFLPVDMQVACIQADTHTLHALCNNNRDLLELTKTLIAWKENTPAQNMKDIQSTCLAQIESLFGEKAFIQAFFHACDIAMKGESTVPKNASAASLEIKKSFLKLENIRAIYD